MKKYNQLLAENRAWAEETFAKIDAKMSKVTLRSREKLPYTTDENGVHMERNISWWTNGFFAGLNWLLYNHTKNSEYRATAERNEQIMDACLSSYATLDHDVGFLFHLMSGASYTLTGNTASKARNLFAASTLFSRFVLGGNYIRAWNAPERINWTIIDTMMNLPLLYWASNQLDDDRFKRIAISHADNTLRTHLRPDGSVNHVVCHDRESGDLVSTCIGQGIAPDSSWSRGQAWAIYGFVLSYIHTGEQRYLDAAVRVANYFIANCFTDWRVRIDFQAPPEPAYYDSTAACISACGMLELARLLPENEGGKYGEAAINLLRRIDECYADYNSQTDGLLTHCSERYPIPNMLDTKTAGVHINIVYGDFFYTEAMLKLLGSSFNPW